MTYPLTFYLHLYPIRLTSPCRAFYLEPQVFSSLPVVSLNAIRKTFLQKWVCVLKSFRCPRRHRLGYGT